MGVQACRCTSPRRPHSPRRPSSDRAVARAIRDWTTLVDFPTASSTGSQGPLSRTAGACLLVRAATQRGAHCPRSSDPRGFSRRSGAAWRRVPVAPSARRGHAPPLRPC